MFAFIILIFTINWHLEFSTNSINISQLGVQTTDLGITHAGTTKPTE